MRERLNAGSVSVLLVLVTKTSTAQNQCAKEPSGTLGLCYVKQCEAKQQTHRRQGKPRLTTICKKKQETELSLLYYAIVLQ
jgi:hypothetical protein